MKSTSSTYAGFKKNLNCKIHKLEICIHHYVFARWIFISYAILLAYFVGALPLRLGRTTDVLSFREKGQVGLLGNFNACVGWSHR